MNRTPLLAVVFYGAALAVTAAESVVKTQTITYDGAASFGIGMDASGDRLAVLATSVPSGGPFGVPFPGKFAPVFIYQFTAQRWEAVALLYEDLDRSVPAGSVTLSGSRLVHGIPQRTTGAGSSAGSVWSYVADPLWRREAEIASPEPLSGAFFGWHVALDGDSLAVLALGSGATPSAVYLYTLSGGAWNHVQTVVPPAPYSRFLSMTMDEDWLAAASHESGGAVFLYKRSRGRFELAQTLVPAAGQTFGGDVLQLAGSMLAVSSPRETVGKVYVYEFADARWSPSQQLDASDRAECTYFGQTLSMSPYKLLVGAPDACVGGKSNSGFSRLYIRVNDTWTRAADFTEETPAQGEVFGRGVAVSGRHVFVNSVSSESNYTASRIDVYSAPPDPLQRRRAVRK